MKYDTEAREIIRVVAGSRVNGMATEDSDTDLMAVYLEPLEATLGLQPYPQSQKYREVPEGTRSRPGDTETSAYSLRHYMALATKGNPNLLTVLYAPQSDVLSVTAAGLALRELAPEIVSQQGVRHHLGYLSGQYNRMRGVGPKQNRKPNRPELVEAHGFDTKYAAHAVRLGWQGCELADTGRITFPLSGSALADVMDLRAGGVSEAEACRMIESLIRALRFRLDHPRLDVLQAEPHWGRVNDFLVYNATHQALALRRHP